MTVSGFANNKSQGGKYSDHLQAKDILVRSWGFGVFFRFLVRVVDGFFYPIANHGISNRAIFFFFISGKKKTGQTFILIKMPEYY